MFIEEVLYYSVHWVIKSAFLWFYLRVSRDHKIMRYAVYVGVGLNTMVWIGSMYVTLRFSLSPSLSPSNLLFRTCLTRNQGLDFPTMYTIR